MTQINIKLKDVENKNLLYLKRYYEKMGYGTVAIETVITGLINEKADAARLETDRLEMEYKDYD